MYVSERGPVVGLIEESRERIYGILEALLSHPDEGKWGRVLRGVEQRLAIATADSLRAAASALEYPLLPEELSCDELDLRCLMVEMCQPLEHLKGEYERVLCVRRPRPGCSPFALDYLRGHDEITPAEFLGDLAGLYRSFGFAEGSKLPGRPDHVAFETGFMAFLIAQKRLISRLAGLDPQGAQQFTRCDLAERSFFSDYLAGWVGSFAAGLREHAGGGYFEPLGRFLSAWIPLERHRFAAESRFEDRQERPQRAIART
jgi:TorA maturation chaperone TorD